MEYIDECTFVHLKIRAWSGQKGLIDHDFKLGEGGKLPSKRAARLGNKFLIDKKLLNPFNSLRTSAGRLCLTVGVRMMGAYAVHNSELDKIEKGLKNHKDKYEQEVKNFLSSYYSNSQDWISKEFDTPQSPVPIADVERAFRFDYTLYQVSGSALPDSSEFTDSLLDDMAKEVKTLWESSVAGKPKVTQRFLNQSFEDVYSKLKLLSFGDGRILKVLSVMDKLRTSFPKSGGFPQGTPEHLILTNILMALMSPDRLEDILNQKGNMWSLPSGQPTHPIATVQQPASSTAVSEQQQQPQPLAAEPVQSQLVPEPAIPEQPVATPPVIPATPLVQSEPKPQPEPEPEIILPETEVVKPATNNFWF